jgi:hypothetical protein
MGSSEVPTILCIHHHELRVETVSIGASGPRDLGLNMHLKLFDFSFLR